MNRNTAIQTTALLAILAMATSAFGQQDGCILDRTTPLLKHADTVKRGGRSEITETVMIHRMTVTVSQGGCAHYGVTFAFEGAAPRKGEALLREAARLLRTVPMKEERRYIIVDVIRLLQQNARSPYTPGETLPNPAHPDINVSVEEERKDHRRTVKVVYSQAL